jgi:hypothetical protein
MSEIDKNLSDSNCPRHFELQSMALEGEKYSKHKTIHKHVESCPNCQAIVEEILSKRQAFLDEYPYSRFQASLTARENESRQRYRWLRLAPIASAAVLLLVIALSIGTLTTDKPTIRMKGSAHLSFFVQRDGKVEEGISGGTYYENDRIQFVYSSVNFKYLFLFSVDQNGRISNFNHLSSAHSVAIQPGNKQVLEGSIILDDSLGPERIFGIFSNKPLEFDEIKQLFSNAYHQTIQQGGNIYSLKELPIQFPHPSILINKK